MPLYRHGQMLAVWLVAVTACAVGCAHPHGLSPNAGVAPSLAGDSAHPGHTQGWEETRLYFGLGLLDHPDQGINEARWRAFLDAEVTPRFPDGLSVLDVYGQWQGKQQVQPERLRSKVVQVFHAATPENDGKIEAIRAAWKKMTGDQSVLRVTQAVSVSF